MIFEFLTRLDHSVFAFVNSLAGRSRLLDHLVRYIDHSQFLKFGLILAVLVWFWFRGREHDEERQVRERIIVAVVAGFFVAFFTRFLGELLPAKMIPAMDPAYHFKALIDAPAIGSAGLGLNSFPSDHAGLFYALAMGVWYISKKTGWLMFVYGFLVIGVVRVFSGHHSPADMVAGMLIGVAVGWLFNRRWVRKSLATPAMRWLSKSPGSFYVCFFLAICQIYTIFDEMSLLGRVVIRELGRFF